MRAYRRSRLCVDLRKLVSRVARVRACMCASARVRFAERGILLDTKVAMKRAKRRQISREYAKIAMRAGARKV